ncbi:3-methyladenine DNA glycosylase [Nocardioides dubius]|uniref:3-methyladenine DNA glycosylase n=1 Tax=Nocardioides dubius TaxID=317019 RepID=A0ABN1U2E6_9ACTN
MNDVLPASQWRALAQAHAERVDTWLEPHLDRRQSGVKHPVHDFLFTYYSYRPAQLRRWHPGFGVGLAEGASYGEFKGYRVVDGVASVSPAFLEKQEQNLRGLRNLLRATLDRSPNFGCFGLHEWAMVYRLSEEETRHSAWPLRLGGAGTDDVVESHRIACSHFDAYRFFTPPAVGLNTLSPGPGDRPEFEQPACLHAGMDLYKHAFRMMPLLPSSLVLEAFELAWDIRALDMRASPYDLSGLPEADGEDWSPVQIETAEGKREYADLQRQFSERAEPIRRRLIAECDRLLGVSGSLSR